MPRLVYPQLTDISTEAAMRKHYAKVGARLGRGAVKSVQDVARPHAKWTKPQIAELKDTKTYFNSPADRRDRLSEARKRLTDTSSAKDIVRAIAAAWNVSPDDLLGFSQRPIHVVPRGIAMAMCRRFTNRTFESIGSIFGARDYSTVFSAVRRYGPLVDAALASAEGERCDTAR